jgi:competence protein ComEC
MLSFLSNAIARLRKVPLERLLLLGIFLLLVGLSVWIYQCWPRPLQVFAFDVGKGDAFVIIEPSGHAMIIDGGSSELPDVGAKTLVPNLMLLGVNEIDAILLSHPDSDHINGLPAIIESIPVKMILDPEIPSEGAEYQQILALAEKKGIPHQRVCAGDRVNLAPDITLSMLAPDKTLITGTHSDTNNNSVVCLLRYRQARMLFTGDLEVEGEQALLAQHVDLHADVLKVAHHGSRYGSTDAFLSAVNPSIGVVSCPAHNPEHPHAETLARLRAHHIKILRTDVYGMIHLSTYGKGWQVDSYL